MLDSAFDRPLLLARCSVLRWFDRALLCTVLHCDDDMAERLLADPAIEVCANGYRLHPDMAALARQHLLDQGPHAETDIHREAFLAYLARMRQSQPHTLRDEDECLYHLNALFVPLLIQMEWTSMRGYAVQILRLRPQRIEHRQRLRLLVGYAMIHLHRHERGERILHTLLNHAQLAADLRLKALKALADGAWFRSRYDEALGYYDRLYQAAIAADDGIYQGIALLNRSIVFHELEAYERALIDVERSLAIFRACGDPIRESHALYHIALFSLHLGRWDAARRYCAEAAAQFTRLGMQIYLGFIAWCEGLLAHISGDQEASAAAYLRGLAIAEAPGGQQLSLALDLHVNLGILYQSANSHQQALDHYQHAMANALRLDRQHQICLIHFRRGQVFEQMGRPGRALLAYRSAIELVERMSSSTTIEDVKISLLGTTQQIYEAIVLLCIWFYEQKRDRRWLERALNYVERARSRAFLDALATKATTQQTLAAAAATPARLSEIQAALPDDALLIEYFSTGVVPRGEHLIARIAADNRKLRAILVLRPRVLAFAISHQQCELFTPAIDPNRLRPPVNDRHPGRHLLLGHLPVTLYEELIAPAEAMLQNKRLLYLIPHGPLHYIPFAALQTPGGLSLLDLCPAAGGDGLALAQAPSATILVRNCLGRAPSQATEVLALGFNDPHGPQPLRLAEAEAAHIAMKLGGQALVGAQPKRAALRQIGNQLRYLHIAGHALFTPSDPLGSWLLLSEGDQLSAREIINEISIDAELVTLSSCTSGTSSVVPGDELLGLPRALLYAGAPTVVCTRWEAVDIVALLVMDHFYRELSQHAPALALRNAQVAVRELTFAQLTDLLDGWNAEEGGLASAIGDPQTLLEEIALVSRGGRHSGMYFADAPDQEVHIAPDPHERPFAAPLLWAPFMVIGKG